MQLHKHQEDDGYIPFSIRFKAWWEGLEPGALVTKKPGAPVSAAAIQIDEPEEPGKTWPESRLSFCRRLWQIEDEDEVVEPGGAEYTGWLLKPMNLSAEVSAIDLSAGLGGGTRKSCKDLNTYIDGYEMDTELAEEAAHLSKKHGVDKRVPIHAYDPESLELPVKKFMGALCRERLYRINHKESYLQTVFNSLRPRGHLIVTDFVVIKASDEDHPTIQAWLARAPEGVRLWTAEDCRKTIVGYGMDMRICEDETDRFRSILLKGWAQFVGGLTKQDLTRDFINDMMREAEYWLMLIRALESGKLRYYRYHAMRGAESIE